MVKWLTLLLILPMMAFATTGTVNEDAGTIEQWGITWTFNQDLNDEVEAGHYLYGQFVTGDYWVVGPATITGISPTSVTVDSGGAWTKNGSMLNPTTNTKQGYDSRPSLSTEFYDATKNVALGVDVDHPFVISNGSRLISTISQSTPGNWPQLTDSAVLTVLAAAPARVVVENPTRISSAAAITSCIS